MKNYIGIFLVTFSLSSHSLLNDDLKCEHSSKNIQFTATVSDYSIAKELFIKSKRLGSCAYKIDYVHDGRKAKSSYIEFGLKKILKKCDSRKKSPYMSKGFLKITSAEKLTTSLLILKGKDSLSCDLSKFKTKAFFK